MKNLRIQSNLNQEFQTEIRRARIKKLTIYEISDAELNILEHGAPYSILLNLSIFLFTTAIATTIALITIKMPLGKIYIAFLIASIIGWLGGIILIILWSRSYRSISLITKTIRDRLPPEGEAEVPQNNILLKYKDIKFKLLSARYGTKEKSIDVYDKLVLMIKNDELKVTSSNSIAGDPLKGVKKKLIINYISYGTIREVEVSENDSITLP